MDQKKSVRDVQEKILEIMKYIDKVCRANGITYFIMGGTALGAVRHGGFIPWDDDLDIFMTPVEYEKFKSVMEVQKQDRFVIQEWKTTPNYVEYAKVRMNGTTFIEEVFKDRKDLHQGIYVDIMILHKCPNDERIQKSLYKKCKYVTLYALSQRNWKPKSTFQRLALIALKFMPNKWMVRKSYESIYQYDYSTLDDYRYFYWITPAKFKQGLFEPWMFEKPVEIPFEDTKLLCSKEIKKYLEYRYGDYMKLPSEEQQRAAVHAMIFDVNKDYTEYIK